MAQTAANVSAAKPKVGGAIYKAPIGTPLPTSATSTLDSAFVSLGYMSDAGLKRAINLSTNPIKAWGGDTIANPQTDKSQQYTFEAAEALNPEVQKLVNGDSNVSGTAATGMTVRVNSAELEEHAYVFEEILRGGVLKRTVIARAGVTSIAEVNDTDNDIIKYGITIRAMADEALGGDTAIEYYKDGSVVETPSVLLSEHVLSLEKDGTASLTAVTTPDGETVTWTTGNSEIADVADGVVSGEGAGNTVITAAITIDGVTYTDTCTVIVTAASS